MGLNPQDYYQAAGGAPDITPTPDAQENLAQLIAQQQAGGSATLTSGLTGQPMAGLDEASAPSFLDSILGRSSPLGAATTDIPELGARLGRGAANATAQLMGGEEADDGRDVTDYALVDRLLAQRGIDPAKLSPEQKRAALNPPGDQPVAPVRTAADALAPASFSGVGGGGQAGAPALPPQPKAPAYDSSGDKEIKQAFDQQIKVAAAQTEIEKQKANLQADAADHKVALDEQRQAAMAQLRLQAKQQYDADMQTTQRAMADYQKLSTTVDPSRWWGSRDTGQKVAASIGVALGGIGSAFTGGPNQALEIVKDAISRDVDAQKESIQAGLTKGKEAISSRLTLLNMNRSKLKDDADALDATYAQMYGTAADKADALAKRLTGNQQAQVTGQQVAAQLRAEQGKALQNISDRANARAQQKFANDLSLHASQRSDAEFALSLANKGGAPDQYVPGLGYALDKDAAKTLRDKKTSYENLDGLIDQAVSLRKKYGSEDIGPAKAQMKSISAQLKKAIISDDGLSTRIGDSELKFLDQMSGGDITNWGYVLPQLESLKKNVNAAFMHVARNHLIPGTRPVESEGGGSYRARKPGE